MTDGMQFSLPNSSEVSLDAGSLASELLAGLQKKQRKTVLAVELNGELLDLHTPLPQGGRVEWVRADHPKALDILRHSTAHLMAASVQRLFPGTLVTIGPEIEDGFYYDFGRDEAFTEADFRAIERDMARQVKQNLPFAQRRMPAEDARKLFQERGERYKVEIIEDLERDAGVTEVTLYQHGEWLDLCRGPHVPHSGWIKAVRLLKGAGAYWRGDEKREQLQRIYGTAWFSKEDLQAYLDRIAEAERRDHRRLGREMKLFFFDPVAPASPFFLPRGTQLYNAMVGYVREQYKVRGYDEVITPQILDTDLWRQSGHLAKFHDLMFFCETDGRDFAVKPMNCPCHTLVFRQHLHSYRDLPVRMADFGRLHRYERSGVTAGLTRVRSFSQDDAHIFCTPAQVGQEVGDVIAMFLDTYRTFGFEEVSVDLATRPERSLGEDELPGADLLWEQAETSLAGALDEAGLSYHRTEGEGAFYGPKIDFMVRDALRRRWQLGTIQLDFLLPMRFELNYVDADGNRKQPVMVHRAMLGSIERFLGVFLEHCGGHLPLWCAPVQARVLTVSEKSEAWGGQVLERLKAAGIRAIGDFSAEKLGSKIRAARPLKEPFLLIVGERDAEAGTVSPRKSDGTELDAMGLESFVEMLQKDGEIPIPT